MNVVRVENEVFERLLVCMRYHQDPENMSIDLENEFGDRLAYENGIISIEHNDRRVCCDISIDQLCKEQKDALGAVLIEQVHRVVCNIIEEVMNVD
tara:strand:- start:161 stop:448 length:288 start_codon:yes stop_codon:yes gene_type:complete